MPQLTGTPGSAGTYTPTIEVTDAAGATATMQYTLVVNTPGGGTTADMFPLPVITELFVNGAWTDISGFVYQRDTIHITGGKTDRSGTANPAQCTLTLNNRDGRFTPNFANGAYYPHIGRNTQIRISLDGAISSSGNTYSGYRFWGEVPEWPPLSDVSGNDVYVSITANGPLRRIRQGGGEGSALQRYYAALTGAYAPIAYWPCEEDPDTGSIGSGVDFGINMTITGTPKFKAVSNFNGSAPIGVLNKSVWDGLTGGPLGSYTGNDVFVTPGTYQWVASTSTVTANLTGGGGAGGNGGWSAGGSGGGFRTASMAVTPGTAYTVVVGGGGGPGGGAATGTDNPGGGGGASVFAGDSATITAAGGKGGPNSATPAAGVSGSGTGTGFTSGAGGAGSHNAATGGGGGSSAGTGANGSAGQAAGTGGGGNGGAAPAGGGAGGKGGPQATGQGTSGYPGKTPGGGGGGGGNTGQGWNHAGAAGAAGQVQLTYTPPAGPPANVIRFILYVPPHGGNNNAVLIRAFTGGTIAKLDCQYRSGGNLRLFGYNSLGSQVIDSGNLSVSADGRTLMVSVELKPSGFPLGSSTAWQLSAIAPGAPGVGGQTVSGVLASAVIGEVSEVVAGPNADVTTTAIGHVSVQYAWIPLWKVSQALDGHQYEATVDRFIRLANEQATGSLVEYAEIHDHWGFEDDNQFWVGTHGSATRSTFTVLSDPAQPIWPTEGTASLQLEADGTGPPYATSAAGLSGEPVQPGDVASVAADLYSPGGISNAYVGLRWYDISGTFLSESDCADTVLPAGQPVTLRLSGKDAIAPADAQWLAVTFGDHNTDGNGTLLYGDHVRLSPHMGVQTRKAYKDFLEEIQDLDQGLLKEAKEFWGLKLSTRIRVINQDPAVQLDYSQATLSPPLAPVLDTQNVKNNIVVHRHKGSKVEVTLDNGQMSIQEPPAGVGRFKKTLKVVAAADEQLAALAAELLTIGTAPDERYPTITADLTRASIPGNALAPLMSAVAGVEVGDMVQLQNLAFWYPSATSNQLVVGYDEVINPFQWTITWNCVSYTPYIQVITSLRRW